jgi:hypothetical protein
MKIYISMNALPWEEFSMTVPDPQNPGQVQKIQAHSNASRAGFLPIFWTKEEAEKTFPGFAIQEGEVPEDWHPMINKMRQATIEEIQSDDLVEVDADVESAQ